MTKHEFVSIHLTESAGDMSRLDDVYRTVAAINRLLGTNLAVQIDFTDGINSVSPDSAKYAEALVTIDGKRD